VITVHQRYRQTDRQLIMAIPGYARLRAVKTSLVLVLITVNKDWM